LAARKATTWFWIDPTDDLIVIGMIQQVAGTGAAAVLGVPDMRGLTPPQTPILRTTPGFYRGVAPNQSAND
jgi:hypothetical protein